jgi:glutamate dehydrogenase
MLKWRVEEEVNLIYKRHRENPENRPYTEISDHISREINSQYDRMFRFFQETKHLVDEPIFRKVILNHLPALVRNSPKYRARIKRLPSKIKSAILAVELAAASVYHGGWEGDFENRLRAFVKSGLPSRKAGGR